MGYNKAKGGHSDEHSIPFDLYLIGFDTRMDALPGPNYSEPIIVA